MRVARELERVAGGEHRVGGGGDEDGADAIVGGLGRGLGSEVKAGFEMGLVDFGGVGGHAVEVDGRVVDLEWSVGVSGGKRGRQGRAPQITRRVCLRLWRHHIMLLSPFDHITVFIE